MESRGEGGGDDVDDGGSELNDADRILKHLPRK